MINKLRAHPRKIIFPEGTDPRILEASARLLSGTFLTPVLIGNPDKIREAAEEICFLLIGDFGGPLAAALENAGAAAFAVM